MFNQFKSPTGGDKFLWVSGISRRKGCHECWLSPFHAIKQLKDRIA
jgi:hypothetical protein